VSANISAISVGDPRYPTALGVIYDPPPRIWVRGDADILHAPAVAVVGSRRASPYALEVAFRLAAGLARRHVTVVSGMARGVDAAAHRGALDAGGVTVAVFGCGIDVIYPREHRTLAEHITACGALVSEFPPGTAPLKSHFPRRNRIISGLSLGVVVVEAADASGSLITADFALDQGRAVFAVPGNVLGGKNGGAHALLRDGAKLVETADDILDELPASLTQPPAGIGDSGSGTGAANGSRKVNLASQDPVLRSMDEGDPYDLDEIAARCGIDRVKLLPRLLELELSGSLQRIEGGRFVRFGVPRPCSKRPGPGSKGGPC